MTRLFAGLAPGLASPAVSSLRRKLTVTSRRPHMNAGRSPTDIRPAITRRRPSTLVSVLALMATAGMADTAVKLGIPSISNWAIWSNARFR
jgi:hypothetical protein